MRVLVTRPAAQASEWVQHLRTAGLLAEALPLIRIQPTPDGAAVSAAWESLPEQHLVLFVSPNAVAHFFAGKPVKVSWPVSLEAASPGPGTTHLLQGCGVQVIVEPAANAAQFDSETLWQQISARSWRDKRVLIVRGAGGREWIADRLREQGASLSFVAAYQRAAPEFSIEQELLLDAALAQPRQHVWLFSSSEAIDHLSARVPHTDWSQARAVVTHPRIAERARRLGIADVVEARPSVEDVIACIQSIAS